MPKITSFKRNLLEMLFCLSDPAIPPWAIIHEKIA